MAKYQSTCDKCGGSGSIEVAQEIYINRFIADKILKQKDNFVSKIMAACNINSTSEIKTHMFSLVEICKIAEILNIKVADLLP